MPHSVLGASTAARWMACPGSTRAAAAAPRTSSEYADQGTRAHAYGAAVLTGKQAVADDDEMARHVEVYTRHCQRLLQHADMHGVEVEVSLAALDPPCDMFGTADFFAYFADRQELHCVDFKYGKGVWVAAKNNPQLLYYALGTMLHLALPVSSVTMTVIQPRYGNGDPIRSAVASFADLTDFAANLLEHARAALAPDAPRVAGDHCKFCPVKPTCLAHQQGRAAAAASTFHKFDLSNAAEFVR
jgi:hypothetical protein